jgi:hypothetical protein
MVTVALGKFRAGLMPHDKAALDAIAVKLATLSPGRSPNRGIETWSRQILHAAPSLTKDESDSLAVYALHALMGDSSLIGANQPKVGPQMSFNLQYLELQSAMQNLERQYQMVSMIMKTKAAVVRNIINSVR